MTRLKRRAFLAGALAAPLAPALAGCAVQTASKTQGIRPVSAVILGQGTRDGAGVKLTRLLGSRKLPMLDPFLLLDEFHSNQPEDFIRGFPTHPHRGFETVTIMLDGEVTHRDSVGNAGTISGGGVQWMTAGRGILHSEMPRASRPGGDLWGYQLWVNLPAAKKWSAPRYQDMEASSFVTASLGDAKARVLAGAVGGARAPIDGIAVKPTVLDLSLEQGAELRHALPAADNSFAFVVEGSTVMGAPEERVSKGSLAVFGRGEQVAMKALEPSRVLLFSARPINEPVARRGPFVMNTDAEIQQAFDDYRAGRLTDG